MLVGVECAYGPGKETVFESAGLCFDGPVAPARGQQVTQVVSMGLKRRFLVLQRQREVEGHQQLFSQIVFPEHSQEA